MRINRQQSHLSFRSNRRRRSGCVSLPLFLGVLVGITGMIVISWQWLGQRFNLNATTTPQTASFAAPQAAFDQGDLDTAIDMAQQILEHNPDDIDALKILTRALIYRSYSDYNQSIDRTIALDVTTAALNRMPNNIDVKALHAFVLQAVGRPVEAAALAREVLNIDAEHTLARTALALSYGSVGSFDVALRESQRAVQSTSTDIDALRALAISYSDLGQYQRAIETINRAIANNNRLLALHFEKALYAMQLGDADAATVAYFQVVTYAPENVKVRLRLCELSSLLRERDSAISYCQQVTEQAPDWADGWFQLGYEYFLQGDFVAARDNLNRCSTLQVMQNIPLAQRHFECWYLQGQAAEILGDCETLLTTYNEFRAMATDAAIQETWTYPPEGPPNCVGFVATAER
ncbi:MAG: hypothetical protein D6737_08550 [Chloroflexi bacterium]|nr:MAG: hypothetical protein D6737_08550 [Chloroflexota bacterium]